MFVGYGVCVECVCVVSVWGFVRVCGVFVWYCVCVFICVLCVSGVCVFGLCLCVVGVCVCVACVCVLRCVWRVMCVEYCELVLCVCLYGVALCVCGMGCV